MAKYTIEDTTLTNIADAIREKGGTTESLTPVQMPEAISAIEAGGNSEPNTLLVRTKSYKPTVVSAYQSAGGTYYNASSSVTNYYWYRSDNSNKYWQLGYWANSLFTEGHQYRVSFWIWHDGTVSDEVIPIWQNKVFINNNVSAEMPITEITAQPQLVSIVITFKPCTAYQFGLWLYPDASSSQIRLTVPVIEDLTSPATTAAIPV